MRNIMFVFAMGTLFISSLFSAYTSNDPRLTSCLYKIEQLPEAQQLLREIRREGEIGFDVVEHHVAAKFGAFWDLDDRMICVNPGFHRDQGEMIGSILFEMQNAYKSKDLHELFEKAGRGEIDRNTYIRGIEFIEYNNSKRAAEMAEKGIQRGLFPQSARLFTYSNFEEHFHYQQVGGHSAQIGRLFDSVAPRSR